MTEENGQGNPQGENTGNPAWNDFLQYVPEDKYSQAQEVLKNWDKGVNDNFVSKKVHSAYEPYSAFVENKVPPTELDEAYQILTALRTNPKEFYDTMTEWLGIEGGQEPQGDPKGNEDAGQGQFKLPPEVQKQLDEQNQTLQQVAQYIVADRSSKEQSQADADFAAEVEAAQETYGREFTDKELKFVVGSTLAGESLEDAVANLQELTGANSKPNPKAPFVLGSGGNFPGGEKFDPTKLSDKQRREAAVAMLEHLHAE